MTLSRFKLPKRHSPLFQSSSDFEMMKKLGEGGFS